MRNIQIRGTIFSFLCVNLKTSKIIVLRNLFQHWVHVCLADNKPKSEPWVEGSSVEIWRVRDMILYILAQLMILGVGVLQCLLSFSFLLCWLQNWKPGHKNNYRMLGLWHDVGAWCSRTFLPSADLAILALLKPFYDVADRILLHDSCWHFEGHLPACISKSYSFS